MIMGLTGTRFATMEDIGSIETPELWKIPKEAFRRGFDNGRRDGARVQL
jgi:hypothetical protein